MTAFWIAFGIVAGLSLMIASGVLAYRFERDRHGSDDAPVAGIAAMALFPIALPIYTMLFIATRDEHHDVVREAERALKERS